MSRGSSRSSSYEGEFDLCSNNNTSIPSQSEPPPDRRLSGDNRSMAGAAGGSQDERRPSKSCSNTSQHRSSTAPRATRRNLHSSTPKSQRPGRHSSADLEATLGSFLDESFQDSLENLNLSEGGWTRDSVARLLQEEAEDVQLAMRMTGRGAGHGAGRGAGRGAGAPSPPRYHLGEPLRHAQRDLRAMPVGDSILFLGDGEDPGNLSPAEVAAMMHRLQHGISMSAPPEQLFKFLFPNAAEVSKKASDAGEEAAGEAGHTYHKDEPCPIVCFGSTFPGGAEASKPLTMLQIRGDAPPPWFPGYFVALPETGGALQVKPSPTEVMHAAYMAARPRNIPPECRFSY